MKANMFHCASQASTATANDERTITAARAIDRHNPIIKDGRRSFPAPCSSGDDYVAPYRQLSKITRIPSSSSDDVKVVQVDRGRRSNSGSLMKLISSDVSLARKSFGCVSTPKTPPGSTRYLLETDPVSLAGSTDQNTLVTEQGEASGPERCSSGGVEEKKKSSGSDLGSGSDQVVVLRVSLHCQCRGCESKVKKHLSRMQGVTSFNIDFASKKITVTGDITPLEVLGCLSKVKSAQFWTTPQSSLPRANSKN